MLTHSPMANVLIVLAVALGVIVVVDMVVLPAIEAYARGCNRSIAFNASQGRCFGH
jgi:hypothetical protein